MQKINPDIIRLSDIVQAIDDIEDYKLTTLTAKKDIHAVCYNIAIGGETIIADLSSVEATRMGTKH